MTPDEILSNFMSKWAGTKDELELALDAFYADIVDSMMKANVSKEAIETVSDYVQNHYF